MNVVFTGWLHGVKTVSLIHSIEKKAGLSLSGAKAVVDAIVNIPIARLKMPDARVASRVATGLEAMGLPCFLSGASIVLGGWASEVEQDGVVEFIMRESMGTPLPLVAEFVRMASSRPSVKVACSSASLAQELVSEARAYGAVCHVVL